ncbi:mitochondrial protein C2orf69 homolog isoform X2 [Biomphalaria glabrata]|uniref:Mitochondrial protein C2orf69 homolog isoform X2 n=1 Tax=Biomphalaria glabrata TaxID=6526 RepID=A0A9W2YB28_BIOGL|nr:mitochondrial protein C2orf69 homolog isoform X2 [Biomphalaria glabrata]XP_055859954.1 mitochondrial protein C2orf69 homolog isoform X2 [Biomphalaria glabrata]
MVIVDVSLSIHYWPLYLEYLNLNSIFGCKLLSMDTTCSASEDFYQQRLHQIAGDADKTNDIYVCGQKQNCKEHIIFFGGDVQDYPENMERHRDNKRYIHWNTESTAKLIHHKFPSSLVFVVKPTRMHLLTFAVYSHFFEANDFGNPTHSDNSGAIRHLNCLYNSAVKVVYSEDDEGSDIANLNVSIRLLGFSKGCTVLNQIVYELHLSDHDPVIKSFLEKVTAFYWLDGGHSGGANSHTWVTDDSALKQLALLGCDIFIHVSPYQVRDPMRKWIGQQESKFYKKLMALKAKVREKEHFESEPACIENHFKVLEVF